MKKQAIQNTGMPLPSLTILEGRAPECSDNLHVTNSTNNTQSHKSLLVMFPLCRNLVVCFSWLKQYGEAEDSSYPWNHNCLKTKGYSLPKYPPKELLVMMVDLDFQLDGPQSHLGGRPLGMPRRDFQIRLTEVRRPSHWWWILRHRLVSMTE